MSTTETPFLALSEKAAAKIKQLMAEDPDGNAAVLRVAIQGGSCSGLEYALGFDQETLETDLVAEQHGVKVAVDPYSAPYLEGATIDFVSVEGEEGFAIDNPKALPSCGCGSSFEGEGEGCGSGGCGSDGCGCG
ncbi:MAG: iron-sulfur cluster assembly accessory protein [Gaiellaceae bacterium]